MPKIHLTAATVEQIKPPESGQVLIWDDEMKGFGMRVTRGKTAAGKKVFIAETRVKGKTRRVKIGEYPFSTPEEARREAKIKIGEMVGGTDHNAEKSAQRAKSITLQEVLDDYCKVKRDLRPRTKEIYQDAMDRCFADWKDKQIVDITRAMVRDRYGRIISKVAESSGKRQYKGDAMASLSMRMLSSLFNFAESNYEDADGRAVVSTNPVKCLSAVRKGWRTVPRRQTVILPGELRNFFLGIQALRNDTARDYLLFLVLTGLRRNEAAQLVWDEVDLTNGFLIIPSERTKNHRPHGLPLSDYLLSMLKRRQQTSTSKFVFPGREDGKGGYYSDPSHAIDVVAKHVGKNFSCHDCRRTLLTIAEMLEVPPYSLKSLVNHSTGDVTAGYIISNIERLREPMQRITSYMLGLMGAPCPESGSNIRSIHSGRRASVVPS